MIWIYGTRIRLAFTVHKQIKGETVSVGKMSLSVCNLAIKLLIGTAIMLPGMYAYKHVFYRVLEIIVI